MKNVENCKKPKNLDFYNPFDSPGKIQLFAVTLNRTLYIGK